MENVKGENIPYISEMHASLAVRIENIFKILDENYSLIIY